MSVIEGNRPTPRLTCRKAFLATGMIVPNLCVYWGAGRPLTLPVLVIMLLVWVCN